MAAIPGADRDEIWCVVKRNINGADVRFIELLDPTIYTDAALTGKSVTAKTLWTGLTHLIGETVTVNADSAPVGTFVVDGSGQITLTTAAFAVEVGLAYTPTLTPNDAHEGAQNGTALGRDKSTWGARSRMAVMSGAWFLEFRQRLPWLLHVD